MRAFNSQSCSHLWTFKHPFHFNAGKLWECLIWWRLIFLLIFWSEWEKEKAIIRAIKGALFPGVCLCVWGFMCICPYTYVCLYLSIFLLLIDSISVKPSMEKEVMFFLFTNKVQWHLCLDSCLRLPWLFVYPLGFLFLPSLVVSPWALYSEIER